MNMPCSLNKIMMIYLCNFPLPCGYIFILYEIKFLLIYPNIFKEKLKAKII